MGEFEMKQITILTIAVIALGSGLAFAITGVPSHQLSTAEWAYEGGETLSLLVVPDGSGAALDAALLPGPSLGGPGGTVDATITLTLRDWFGYPIVNFPPEDLWLEVRDGGMSRCPNATVADAPTDLQGQTRWALPLRAGGWSTAGMQVFINGVALTQPEFPLQVNSPDIDGDRKVDLVDVGRFAADFYTGYSYRSDFDYNGTLNVGDVGVLARALGAGCP
jgi:hypothetical protein